MNRVPALEAQKTIWCSRTPMNRLGNVDELNNLAVFLASDGSTFMTGSDVVIDVSFPVTSVPLKIFFINIFVYRVVTARGKN